MTETEWLAATDPQPMLVCFRKEASDRKLRLFAVACCGRVWHLLDESGRQSTEVAELFAEGKATAEELFAAWENGPAAATIAFLAASSASARVSGSVATAQEPVWGAAATVAQTQEREKHAVLLRDIFGNPFRPVVVEPSWLTSTVLALATGIYEEKAFDRMPILADALQDAGCDNEDILNHCRQPGPHVRGCWVIDLLTGRK